MARSGKNKLRNWEFPTGSGIRVRELINRSSGSDFGLSYRVTIPERIAGARQFKQFPTVDAAETWAKAQHQAIKADGKKHFLLTSIQREEVFSALSILNGTGLTLPQAAALAKRHHLPTGGKKSVQEAVKQMLVAKESENLRDRSIADLRARLNIFAQTFGDLAVSDITTPEIEQWLQELRGISDRSAEDLSPRTKKNYLITIRTFFNYAIAKGWRGSENPARSISAPKIDWESPAILTVEETKQLLKAAQVEQDGRLLPATVLGLFAGIRSNEITRLDWSAIDLKEGIITIGPHIAKKRRLRLLELMPNCIAWLKTCQSDSGPLAPAKFPQRWTKFVKKAGFADWGENRSNAMRHSFGSYHYALHSDAGKTAGMLGHRSSDQVLFDSYRSLARKKDAEAYFALSPDTC